MSASRSKSSSRAANSDARKKKKARRQAAERTVGYFQLFRYANAWDWTLIGVALILTTLKAMVHPIAIIVYSELLGMFIDRNLGYGTTSKTYSLPLFGGGKILVNGSHEENMAELKKDSMAFGILLLLDSALLFVTGVAYVALFNHVALNMIVRMRRKFFEATIRKDIGWHDVAQDQNFALRITDNMEKIRNGMAENVGHFVQLVIDIIVSIVISFVYGWRLTLAICVYIPITIAINVFVSKYQSRLTTREQNYHAKAGSVAEEVIGAIRTVVAFGGEATEAKRYEQELVPARKAAITRGIFTGVSDALLKGMLFFVSAAACCYGAYLIVEDRNKPADEMEYTPAILSIVISGIIVGSDHISRLTPFLEAFATARGSAVAIFDVIDAPTAIDPMSEEGKILNYGLRGAIEFQDVFFRYPSRDETVVLSGINLSVQPGQTVALVGYSGSGKSTCVQLLQRFYDPVFGRILLDGEDLRHYNVSWLRSNLAVVGQEPVLFQGTIAENIRHSKPDATQKELEDAAKAAGAHEFIIALSKGYNTVLSERGVQLSGGQKQRIAIARALIQNPKVLLLDEATSALDYHSEKLVQSALNRASKGRTTLVVSHRLSAICGADHIVFIDKGKVLEQGSHEELMKLQGKYHEMVSAHGYEANLEEVKEVVEGVEELEFAERKETLEDLPHRGLEASRKLSTLSEGLPARHLLPRYSEASIDGNVANMLDYRKHASLASEDELMPEATDGLSYSRSFMKIVRWARPEWGFLGVAAICAGLYGCSLPAFAMVYAELYAALGDPDNEQVLTRTANMSMVSIAVGVAAAVVCLTQTYFFNVAGVWLTNRIRLLTFKSIMRQEMGWFDLKENSVGSVSARLAGDAASVQGAIGFPLSNIIQAFTNFICSFSIAFSYSWELALVCLCTSPFMVASIIFEARYSNKSALKEKEVLEETSRIATEAITQIRTVAGLRREPGLIEEYDAEIERYVTAIKGRLRYRGLVNSLGMTIMFVGYGITLTYGGYMCADGRIPFENILKIANSMLYGLFILAQSLAFTPAFNAAIISSNRIGHILGREPAIQSPDIYSVRLANGSPGGEQGKLNAPSQGVSYRDIRFAYPRRPEQPVLRGLNLDVLQGKTVALVGASGCGKSTCVQLLQRYYDPCGGKILIDQADIHQDMELPALRRRLGIVSQEPSLFEKTIAENIAYGDTSRVVPAHQIVEAAKMANAHDFIQALPSGYETCLGGKGTQLSGGQKQRIAIARALVRNPKILLLDEATSALDLQSERIVQQALDEACHGRTCIVIAHRLSTVQNADLICVVQGGRIVEQGTHPQLLAKNGAYAKFYHSQQSTF